MMKLRVGFKTDYSRDKNKVEKLGQNFSKL